MFNIFLACLTMVFSFDLFIISYQLQGVNRAVINMPISILETSIPLLSNEDTLVPYYDQSILEGKVINYYDFSIQNYVKSYDLSFNYYEQSDRSVCLSEECSAVEITVSATIVFNYEYHRTMHYEIWRM